MVKKLTGRKENYITDILKIKGGGLYAFTPFSNLTRVGNKTLVKIGFATTFFKRFEQYYTSFPTGVYIINFLENPTVDKATREQRNDNRKFYYVKRALYCVIEKEIMKRIIEKGGIQIRSKNRIRKANEDGGLTEWFYTDIKTVNDVFKDVSEIFKGGKLYKGPDNIKEKGKEEMALPKDKFVGNVVTFI